MKLPDEQRTAMSSVPRCVARRRQFIERTRAARSQGRYAVLRKTEVYMIVFYNGKVYSGGVMKSALVTEGKKIVYVGDDETAKAMAAGAKAEGRAGDGVRLVDLQGRLVLPGFVDSHAHPGYTAKMFEDKIALAECSTKEEVLQAVKDFVVQNPDITCY